MTTVEFGFIFAGNKTYSANYRKKHCNNYCNTCIFRASASVILEAGASRYKLDYYYYLMFGIGNDIAYFSANYCYCNNLSVLLITLMRYLFILFI